MARLVTFLGALASPALALVSSLALSGSAQAGPVNLFIAPANDTSTATAGQVRAFNSLTGVFEGVVAPAQGNSQIQGLTRGPDGSLYGSYFDSRSNIDGRVLRIKPDGTVETFVAAGSGGLKSPAGLTFGATGDLYVANAGGLAGSVLRYDGATGAFLGVFAATGISVPQDIVFGADGHLYVSNGYTDSISRYDGLTGAFLGYFVAPGAFGLDAPIGMAFSSDLDLYVASFPTNRVFRFASGGGTLISTFDLPYVDGTDTLLDVAFGPDQRLYTATRLAQGGTQFLRLDASTGAVLSVFGSMDAPFSFNTGMVFADAGCASLGAAAGQASGCYVPGGVAVPERAPTAWLLAVGLCALGALRRACRSRVDDCCD